MKDRLRDLWDALHSSFWFVPALMAFVAIILSFVTIRIDKATTAAFANSVGYIWSGGAEGARSILSTVAGSMITVAGVVFSIVIVALTLASSQFGPRLLRNFVRDTGNQITLGVFIATFLYCILILRTIRVKDEGNFIPNISITCGLALAIASIGILIYFIHHVSVAIQAENVIARVGHDLAATIEAHFPAHTQDELAVPSHAFDGPALLLLAQKAGYLQALDRGNLVEHARKAGLTVLVRKLPGDYIFARDVLLEARGSSVRTLSSTFEKSAQRCFTVGNQRTESQDVRYGARQLSEIASRALSPGINDPYTAVGCIDWGAEALGRIAERSEAPCIYADAMGIPRLTLDGPATFAVMCAVLLNPLIAYGLDSAIIVCHLLFSLDRVTERLRVPAQAGTLLQFVQRIRAVSHTLLKDENEKQHVVLKARALETKLVQKAGILP